jgi:hypothetical protein
MHHKTANASHPFQVLSHKQSKKRTSINQNLDQPTNHHKLNPLPSQHLCTESPTNKKAVKFQLPHTANTYQNKQCNLQENIHQHMINNNGNIKSQRSKSQIYHPF